LPVATALTVQDYDAAYASYPVSSEIIAAQLEVLWAYYHPDLIKVGLVGSAETANVIADFTLRHGLRMVLDPVTASSSGLALTDDEAEAAIRILLVPNAFLLTPNADEAAELANMEVKTPEQAESAARVICGFGARNVWVTGGHLDTPGRIVDTLYNGSEIRAMVSERVSGSARGTGCAAASAAAARLARGDDIETAVENARKYTAGIIGGP
jgi:hydroxymethylpyrimidine kinase/phosphomethylpyrimidine kinase